MSELLLVPAGAGAGKTHRIMTTLTDWVKSGVVRPERILAVTFTDAAASELRQRIRTSLLEAGAVDAALAIDRAYVSTIHALGLRILTEHALANGSSPMPRLLADEERDLLLRLEIARCERLRLLSEDLPRHGYQGGFDGETTIEDSFRAQVFSTINLLRNLGDRASYAGLARMAQEAIRATYGASARDGAALGDQLSKAVTALLTAFPSGVGHITDAKTARAAFEDDHRQLRRARDRSVLDHDWQLWSRLRKLRQSKKGCPTPDGYDECAAAVIAAADMLSVHPGPLVDACEHVAALVEGAQEILAGYAERKRELGVIDYADMVTNAECLLRHDNGVLGSLLAEIDCVIVDEFQDTNPIQFALLWRLGLVAARTLLVGDIKQAIMGFQGADSRLTEGLVAANADKVQPLDRNWRSDARIMAFVNAIGPRLFPGGYLPLSPQRPSGAESALEVLDIEKGRASRAPAARPEHHVAARLFNVLQDRKQWVADRHTQKGRRLEPRDVAVLCPTHALSTRYAAALRALGLPVRVNAGGWYSSELVRAARNAVALASDPSDRHSALCFAVLGPARIPLQDALQRLADGTLLEEPAFAWLNALSPCAKRLPLPTLLNAVIAATGLRDWAEQQQDPRQARADLLRLEAEAQGFLDTHRDMKAAAGFYGSDAKVFLGWLQARLGAHDFDRRPDPSSGAADGIEIVTWHACKGREWPVVVVAGLDHDFSPWPGTLSTVFESFDDLDAVLDRASVRFCPPFAAEEVRDRFLDELMPDANATARRLLYVALTRARDKLIIEWPAFHLKKGIDEEKGCRSYAHVLTSACGLSLGEGRLMLNGAGFRARVTHCPEDMPPEFDEAAELPVLQRRYGFGRMAILPDAPREAGAPWLIQPSGLVYAALPLPTVIARAGVGTSFAVPDHLFCVNTDRGTALHQALRVMMERPEMKLRLPGHTGLDAETVERVAHQALAVKSWLEDGGYTRISHEVPLVGLDANGSSVSAIVDCLAEGDDGLAIIDHKSDPVDDPEGRFPVYWPQLSAYVEAVGRAWPEKRVSLVGIHWMTRGVVTFSEF